MSNNSGEPVKLTSQLIELLLHIENKIEYQGPIKERDRLREFMNSVMDNMDLPVSYIQSRTRYFTIRGMEVPSCRSIKEIRETAVRLADPSV